MATTSVKALLQSIPPQFKVPNVSKLTSSVARVVGMNPHAMTLGGSNTYLVGARGTFSGDLVLASDAPPPTASTSSVSTGLAMLVDSGEGKPLYAPLINYALASSPATTSHTRLGAIFLTHWHGDHVGGVCDVLMDVENSLMTGPAASNTPSSSDSNALFAIFKKDGAVMSNATLHELLSSQLKLKVTQRIALIDAVMAQYNLLSGAKISSTTDGDSVLLFDLRNGGRVTVPNTSNLSAESIADSLSLTDADIWQFASKYYHRHQQRTLLTTNSSASPSSSSEITFTDGIPNFILSGADDVTNTVVTIPLTSLAREKNFLGQLAIPAIIDPSCVETSVNVCVDGADVGIMYTPSTVADRTTTKSNSTVHQLGNFIFGDKKNSADAPTTFTILTSPGHTDDHTVVYNHAEGLLITADTVLGSFASLPTPANPKPAPITTAFTCYSDYMQTLKDISSQSEVKIEVPTTISSQSSASAPLRIAYILPGHGTVIPEHSEKRVDYYIAHREKRQVQVAAVLEKVKKAHFDKIEAEKSGQPYVAPARSPSLAKATSASTASLSANGVPYAPNTAAGLVDTIYNGVIPAGSNLVTAAQGNVLHILRKLLLQKKVVVTGPSSAASSASLNSPTSTDLNDSLVQSFIAEEDYPRQLYKLPPSEAPSEDMLLKEVYASLGGSGESPPPMVKDTDAAASSQKPPAQRYSTELVWHIL